LNLKKEAEGVQRLCVEPAEGASGPGKPVCARIAELGALAQGIGGDVPSLHDLVNPEPNHGKLSEKGAVLTPAASLAVCNTALYIPLH
jgi:hypothetical protein